ncbi:MBL fold metallo-hydrolase [bacterium 1xD42-67]|mgnify:CR=1 FL=1|nr:MBL fold metallo-hydrolase [uncultured Acetatifactor sp.]RKI68180.1 MBL fold metallo-hydrolase [bacterium 1xD42-67]
MSDLTIYRGTHQIGGCCTEISVDGKRILIDFGANLPDTDETSPLPDQKLTSQVFDGRPTEAVLFTHYHGDHYGLFKSIPKNVPLYIGPLAKQILNVLVPYIDLGEKEKGLPRVQGMKTYPYKKWIKPAPGIRVLPLYVDHSALDAYMFYIEAAGKRILFTGDFRDHGIVGEKDRVWRTLAAYVPQNIDLLITESTMLSRERTAQQAPWFDENGDEHIPVKTEAELGRRAAEVFRRSKYNFVLVSSTNLDSIMEFYHHTPRGMHFVCDFYQARIMITAMRGMEAKGDFPEYQPSWKHPTVRVLGKPDYRWAQLREIGKAMKHPLYFKSISEEAPELERDGFVLLARKNTHPETYTSPFETMRDTYFQQGGQLIYSMWDGYLQPDHADRDLLRYIGSRKIVHLHTSGHAYVETIAKLIETVNPKVIIPMHTERAEEFSSIPEFARWKDRVKVLTDGEPLDLDEICAQV